MGCKDGPVQNCVLPMVTVWKKLVKSQVNASKYCVFDENKTNFYINYRACFNIHNYFSEQATSNFGCDKLYVGLLSIFPHASPRKLSFTTSHTKSTKILELVNKLAMTPRTQHFIIRYRGIRHLVDFECLINKRLWKSIYNLIHNGNVHPGRVSHAHCWLNIMKPLRKIGSFIAT